jgi:aspartate/methionine/tyrosine aminotransferase
MEQLALRDGVATVSGDTFGLAIPGACVLRLSYGSLQEPQLGRALERLGEGLRGWCGR